MATRVESTPDYEKDEPGVTRSRMISDASAGAERPGAEVRRERGARNRVPLSQTAASC
jgi:hypothetical protein